MVNPERIAKGMYWDRAWSLVEGCSYISEGCAHCWAAAQAHMRARQKNEKIRARYEGLTTGEGRWNGKIRLLTGNLDLPLRVKKPTVWAVWNDLFHCCVPDEFLDKAFMAMAVSKHHTFLVLTKRPERMKQYIDGCERGANDVGGKFPWPNVWLGVTAESQEQADKRIPVLLQIPAAVRFVSVEPMLGLVWLEPWLLPEGFEVTDDLLDAPDGAIYGRFERVDDYWEPIMPKIDWVICGGETGPGRRQANIEWIRSLKDQCVPAGVSFFLKQMEIGSKVVKMPELDGMVWTQVPEVGQ